MNAHRPPRVARRWLLVAAVVLGPAARAEDDLPRDCSPGLLGQPCEADDGSVGKCVQGTRLGKPFPYCQRELWVGPLEQPRKHVTLFAAVSVAVVVAITVGLRRLRRAQAEHRRQARRD